MADVGSSLFCTGCGWEVPAAERSPYACPQARPGDDVDHVLRRRLEIPAAERERLGRRFVSDEPNPFLGFRELFHSYRTARAWGATDEDFVALVKELDDRVAQVAGAGFGRTPFEASAGLAGALGCAEAWVKDETGNVGGTHKGRHLAGLMLWLLMEEHTRSGAAAERPRLAISSCGNAAFAASLIARAEEWPIDVFVPDDVDPAIGDGLTAAGAALRRCERRPGEAGDPCYLRFVDSVSGGSLPFTCQGPSNGLVIEGGQTLIWEIVAELVRNRSRIDRLFVQTGGGALATACVVGWREAARIVEVGPLPALHAVQTEGASPLVRAYDALAARLAVRYLGAEPVPETRLDVRAELASRIRAEIDPARIRDELDYAARHRSEFMWPWETEPRSIADAILDDETYDWLALVSGMLESGGFPIVVSEERLVAANDLALSGTGIGVSATGSAGLAGALELAAVGLLAATDRLGLLFTGARTR